MSESPARRIILVLDIGNSDTVFAAYRGEKQATSWRVASSALRTQNEVWRLIEREFRRSRLSPGAIAGSAIASVNPVTTKLCSSALRQHLHHVPLIIHGGLDVGLEVRYANPRQLGPDRLCNAVAAFHLFGGPVIAVDCGTATTFDVVTQGGVFMGGAIAPGIRTAAEGLHNATARLPMIDLHFPNRAIGSDTIWCMQAGVLFGAVDGINGMIRRIRKITGPSTKVVLTGGYSPLIRSRIVNADAVRPFLVLEGALRIYRRLREGDRPSLFSGARGNVTENSLPL